MSIFVIFLSFSFFLFYFKTCSLKLYTCGSLWGKYFFIHLWQTSSVHALELFFLHHTVYIQTLFTFKDFHFSQPTLMVHTKVSSYALVAHTHKNSFPRIIYTQESFYTHFLLHTCINKNLFLFFMHMTFIHNVFFLFFIRVLVHFIFLERRS